MASREYRTCEICGEEFDMSKAKARKVDAEGFFACDDCDAMDRIAAFDFTDDRGAFSW